MPEPTLAPNRACAIIVGKAGWCIFRTQDLVAVLPQKPQVPPECPEKTEGTNLAERAERDAPRRGPMLFQ